jgi:hypothetical protein
VCSLSPDRPVVDRLLAGATDGQPLILRRASVRAR